MTPRDFQRAIHENPQVLVGMGVIVQRVDSPGHGKAGRIDRVVEGAPFPVHVTWGPGEHGGAWLLLAEVRFSQVML